MNEAEPGLGPEPLGLAAGVVIAVTMQHYLGAAGCHRFHLHLRSGDRHHDHCPAAQPLGRHRHPLSMVAGTGGDYTPLQFSRAQPHHLVVGAAQLEAEHRLEVLALQQYAVAEPGREVGGGIEGRLDRHLVHPGPQHSLQVTVGIGRHRR